MIDLFALSRPFLMALDPERAHSLTLTALRVGLGARRTAPDPPSLAQHVLGQDFSNPVGLAAGFDKDAMVPAAMAALGFGFVEVGTITPRPQTGNPRPRVFRLAEDRAIINRLGFNNRGLAFAHAKLKARGATVVGVNLGANKDSDDRLADYVEGLTRLGPLASYIAVNISSPNTPGLRDLQSRDTLDRLAASLIAARKTTGLRLPILLKIAPDLDDDALADIVAVALGHGIDGLIVSNTTITRPPLKNVHASQEGGLSGRPLFGLSSARLAEVGRLSEGRLVLIGVGGIGSGADAYAKIRAGASLVQLYTALVYEGPALIGRIKAELTALLARDGFANVADAVGADQAWHGVKSAPKGDPRV